MKIKKSANEANLELAPVDSLLAKIRDLFTPAERIMLGCLINSTAAMLNEHEREAKRIAEQVQEDRIADLWGARGMVAKKAAAIRAASLN